MSLRSHSGCLLLVCAALGMLAGCAEFGSPGEAGPAVSAPTYSVGDRWVYSAKDGFRSPVVWQETREVTAVNASGVTVRVTQKGPSVDNVRTEIWAAPELVNVGAAFDEETRRFATPLGVTRDTSRPLGIAARRYYRVDYHPGPWIESWLDLWDGDLLLPGYGWLFPVAGGRINLGAGLLNTFSNFQDISAQRLFDAFARMLPADWGIGEETAEGRVLSGPLPMGLNRTPRAVPGLLLIGDAAGAVNPFNGEGIAYAIETGEMAADLVHEALVNDRPALTMQYPQVLEDAYGAYYAVGRQFAKLIGKPAVMGRATAKLLPHRGIMAFALRTMANLSDGRDGDLQDRMLDLALRLAKAA